MKALFPYRWAMPQSTCWAEFFAHSPENVFIVIFASECDVDTPSIFFVASDRSTFGPF